MRRILIHMARATIFAGQVNQGQVADNDDNDINRHLSADGSVLDEAKSYCRSQVSGCPMIRLDTVSARHPSMGVGLFEGAMPIRVAVRLSKPTVLFCFI